MAYSHCTGPYREQDWHNRKQWVTVLVPCLGPGFLDEISEPIDSSSIPGPLPVKVPCSVTTYLFGWRIFDAEFSLLNKFQEMLLIYVPSLLLWVITE